LQSFDGAIKKLFRKTKDLDKMPFADGRVNFYTITLYDLETWEEVDYVIDGSYSWKCLASLLTELQVT